MHGCLRITVTELFLFRRESGQNFLDYDWEKRAAIKRYCLSLLRANTRHNGSCCWIQFRSKIVIITFKLRWHGRVKAKIRIPTIVSTTPRSSTSTTIRSSSTRTGSTRRTRTMVRLRCSSRSISAVKYKVSSGMPFVLAGDPGGANPAAEHSPDLVNNFLQSNIFLSVESPAFFHQSNQEAEGVQLDTGSL